MANHCHIRPAARLALAVFWTLAVAVTLAHQERAAMPSGHVIRGRVIDPDRLQPEDAVLMLGREERGGFSSAPVPLQPDGSFVTQRLSPGTYVLEVVRTPYSATKPAAVVGFAIVPVNTVDVSGVAVTVRRDTAITGRFRMESDNPKAAWPPHIGVTAYLALDGQSFLGSTGAEGAPGGKFVLRNAFGPRVLRCGYTIAPGNPWWPSRVILDGVDITNVPTDFSEHEGGDLQVVFTQHPARIVGTVTDAQGLPVRMPWILVASADRTLWQYWASTAYVAQGDVNGKFSIAVLPGRYLVSAVPQAALPSRNAALEQVQRLAARGVEAEVGERQRTTVNVVVQER